MMRGLQLLILVVTTATFSTVKDGVHCCPYGQETTQGNDGLMKSSGCSQQSDSLFFTDPGKEIAFVLDGSGSIDPPDFELAKQFIANVMRTIWSKCFNCKFAVVQYGDIVRTELSLKENNNRTKASSKVAGIKQIKRVTVTASAINHVLEHVFITEGGSKESSKKYIIVITDGRIFMDSMTLTEVLQNPKMKNITRFAVGVGPDVLNHSIALAEMREIASDPEDEHMFKVDDYSALEAISHSLQFIITKTETTTHQTSISGTEDSGTEIAVVLDGSGSIDPPDFEFAKHFITVLMTTAWSYCLECKFAVVQYGYIVKTELSLKENDNRIKALRKVADIKQVKHVTRTASAINHVLEHIFITERGSNENSKKHIIVITDGRIFMDNMTLTEVLQNPKMKNITRFAVGVGPDVLSNSIALAEMREIASDPDDEHFFKVDNYGALMTIRYSLLSAITGKETTPPTPHSLKI